MICGSKHTWDMTSEYSVSRFSDGLVLDGPGLGMKGMPDGVGSTALQTGGDIVAATIRLDHLDKKEVMDILKALQPYDNNLQVVTKSDANASDGSLGLNLQGSSEVVIFAQVKDYSVAFFPKYRRE